MYQRKQEKDIFCPLEYGMELFGGKWSFPHHLHARRAGHAALQRTAHADGQHHRRGSRLNAEIPHRQRHRPAQILQRNSPACGLHSF